MMEPKADSCFPVDVAWNVGVEQNFFASIVVEGVCFTGRVRKAAAALSMHATYVPYNFCDLCSYALMRLCRNGALTTPNAGVRFRTGVAE